MTKNSTQEQVLADLERRQPGFLDRFEVLSEYQSLTVPIQLRCKDCQYKFERTVQNIRKCKQSQCPACGNGPRSVVVRGLNDLWTTHPHIAELLVNSEDGYKYAAQNTVKLDFKCSDCGDIASRWLYYVAQTMPYCQKCGDKRSYSERLMSAVLRNLDIKFEVEKSFGWCKFVIDGQHKFGKYDFYFELNGSKYIIETDGDYHYNEQRNCFGRNTKNVQGVDIIKTSLAGQNGYILIRIDCQVSSLEYVRKSIEGSKLADILELTRIDWNWCQLQTITDIMMKAAELWNTGMKSTSQIAKRIGAKDRHVVCRYLKDCAANGLCDYTAEEAREHCIINSKKTISKRVVLVNTGEVFESMHEGGQKYGAIGDKIALVCKGKRLYAGKLNDIPLVWRFENEVQGRDLKALLDHELQRISECIIKQREGLRRGLLARHARNKI